MRNALTLHFVRMCHVVLVVCMLAACSFRADTTSGANSAAESGPAKSAAVQAVRIETTPKAESESNAYQTITQGSREWKQGRYEIGIRGGQLDVITVSCDPKSFNPWVADDSFSQDLCSLLFRGLAEVDHLSGEIIPDMAAEIRVEPDQVTYITRLRKGMKWSDGEPITAEDVAFTWNKIIAQGYASSSLSEALQVHGKMPSCEVVDELTNKFITATPCVSFKRRLAAFKIAPRHSLESSVDSKDRAGFKQLWAADKDLSQIVTSGPFQLSEYVSGHKVDFNRANNFYMIDKNGNQLPYLERLVYMIVPDAGSVVLEFGKKDADVAHFRPRDQKWMSSQQQAGNFKLYNLGADNGSFFLVLNMNRRKNAKTEQNFVDPIKSAWFNDTNFRQAINHAINRQQIVNSFFKGAGSQSFSGMPQCSPFHNPDLKPFAQDLKLAQELLSNSGFNKSRDGRLYDSSGHRVEFNLSYLDKSRFYEAVANQILADLRQLGITIRKCPIDSDTVREFLDGRVNWEAQLFAVTCDPLDPNSSASVYCSHGLLHMFDLREPDQKGEVVVSDARPWEQRIDEVYRKGEQEFDLQKRKMFYFEAEKIVYDEAPFIYLASPNVLIGARNTVKNFAPTSFSQASLGLHNIEEIYIEQSLTKPQYTSKKPSES